MRLITYASGPNGLARLGVRVGHRVLDVEAASRVDGEPLPSTMKGLFREGRGALSRVRALAKAAQSSAGRFSSAMLEEKAIRFLPPLPDPDRFLRMEGDNRSHREEPGCALVGHNAKVARPADAGSLDCGPRLVFVVGRHALGASVDDDAMDYIAGVTVLTDLLDPAAQQTDAPGLGAIGPEIVTIDEIGDPYDLWVTCEVNGEERLRVNSGGQMRSMMAILEHLSRTTALEPGDLVVAGTGEDAGAVAIKPGDVIDCSIEGLTTLRTTIAPS